MYCLYFSLTLKYTFTNLGIFVLFIDMFQSYHMDPGGSDSKASVYNAGDPSSIPGSGRSPREGNGNAVQYSCLENPMDRGA